MSRDELAAFDERSERQKQAAVLRSLADQIAAPVVAGRKSRKPLKPEHKAEWQKCIEIITQDAGRSVTKFDANTVAWQWREQCRSAGVAFGWIIGRILFRLLLELAQRWIESQRQNESRVSDR